jgi:phosphatidylglycerophosphate synthase
MLALALSVPDAVDPELKLAGLSLYLRTVLTLQKQGADRILLLADADLATRIEADARVRVPVERVDAPPSDPFFFARHDLVVDPGSEATILETADLAALTRHVHKHGWSVDVSDAVGQKQAVTRLFASCRKPVDGIVARHFNRYVSLFISRLLVDTPITPNMMTSATFGVSLVAAWLVLDPSYATTAAAGVLMQLNSILDGCDGELARVRYQGSKLGEWLDTIGDDLSNVLFWIALGFGAQHVPEHGAFLAACAWAAAAFYGLMAVQNYAVLSQKGSGDFYALLEGESAYALVRFFMLLLKQDFFLALIMALAVAGYLHWGTPLFAAAAFVTWVSSCVRTLTFFMQGQPKSK